MSIAIFYLFIEKDRLNNVDLDLGRTCPLHNATISTDLKPHTQQQNIANSHLSRCFSQQFLGASNYAHLKYCYIATR